VPEYLAPGVYVEETSFRPKTIEGVSTSTAGFVGPTRFGPDKEEPPLLTSFADFERIYGGLEDLKFKGEEATRNYLAYGVRAFFEEGGQRCYVARVTGENAGEAGLEVPMDSIGSVTSISGTLNLEARFPGRFGEVKVTFSPVLSGNVLRINDSGDPELSGLNVGDTVVRKPDSSKPEFYDYDVDSGSWKLKAPDGSTLQKADLGSSDEVYRLLVNISVQTPQQGPSGTGVVYGTPRSIGEFTLRPGTDRSFADYFAKDPPSDQVRYSTPFFFDVSNVNFDDVDSKLGAGFAQILFSLKQDNTEPDDQWHLGDLQEDSRTLELDNEYDGERPGPDHYAGTDGSPDEKVQKGLGALQDIDEVSIVAAPGYTAENVGNPEAIQSNLISHCERLQYRIAVLDTKPGDGIGSVRNWRAQIDSSHAAMYYPWITIFDPVDRRELNIPSSGATAGIYARNDIENGVHKAPANEVVRSAVGLETRINKAQQDVLNPAGVNCYRFFEGRGYRLWGARMATSDNEYKYVNIRRYLAYLERSIDEGTQVFVFENNGADLWRNVRRTIGSFLKNEWRSDRLMGTTPEEAYFVKCDRSTMTQNDIDNGRLICEIGVALFRPAEFVIFRIGQKLLSDTG